MLSEAEIAVLEGRLIVNDGYARVLIHRIRRKLMNFESRVLPALAKNEETSAWLIYICDVIKNSNDVTKFRNNNPNADFFRKGFFSNFVVGPRGFEPRTPGLEGRCPIHTRPRAP